MMIKKTYVFTLLLFLTSFSLFSQTDFTSGYFINNSGEKTDCLIKNQDWKYNPTTFLYKLTESSEEQEASINAVKEFSIINHSKYIRQDINVDTSSDIIGNLNYDKEPIWEKRLMFLKVVLEGNGNLYYYRTSGLKRFFYSIGKGDVQQLVYKRYFTNESLVKNNDNFKQQLLNSFSDCENISKSSYGNISYSSSSLSRIFEKYNACLDGSTVTYNKSNRKTDFNLTAKAGLYFQSINIKNSAVQTLGADFSGLSGSRFEIEGEVVFPFNNNKWSFFIGFAKNSNIDESITIQTSSSITPEQEARLIYESTEILLGARHYMYINEDSKVSLHLGYLNDTRSKLELDYQFSPTIEDSRGYSNFFGGAGFHYKKFLVEVSMNFGKDLFVESNNYSTDATQINIMLGYTIF